MCDRGAAGKPGKRGAADRAEGKVGKAGWLGQGERKSGKTGRRGSGERKSGESWVARIRRKEKFADSFAAAERTNKTFALLNTGKSGIDENLPC